MTKCSGARPWVKPLMLVTTTAVTPVGMPGVKVFWTKMGRMGDPALPGERTVSEKSVSRRPKPLAPPTTAEPGMIWAVPLKCFAPELELPAPWSNSIVPIKGLRSPGPLSTMQNPAGGRNSR
jgi:hypothetical protein